jgi:hypothetical protein
VLCEFVYFTFRHVRIGMSECLIDGEMMVILRVPVSLTLLYENDAIRFDEFMIEEAGHHKVLIR